MRFFAQHGFYEEERILGNFFFVDVLIEYNSKAAAAGDDLDEAINYEIIYLICQQVMRKPSDLIETVAAAIAQQLKAQFSSMQTLTVVLRKANPPMEGAVGQSVLTHAEDFKTKCARCSNNMACYQDKNCWCAQTRVFAKTQQIVKENYGNKCLCKQCLTDLGG